MKWISSVRIALLIRPWRHGLAQGPFFSGAKSGAQQARERRTKEAAHEQTEAQVAFSNCFPMAVSILDRNIDKLE